LAEASSCCGQAAANYTVLMLKQKYSLNLGIGLADVQGRVSTSDQFMLWPETKTLRRLRYGLNAAYEVRDRHQVFANASFVQGEYRNFSVSQSASNPSDVLLGYSYEVLPEYTYSRWKPIVYLSAFINLPTGTSIYDDESLLEGAGVTGHGQTGLGLGFTIKKTLSPWTLVAQARMIRLFEEDFSVASVSGFNDGAISGIATYASSLWGLSLSGGLTWSFLTPRTLINQNLTSESSDFLAVVLALQKVFSDEFSVSFSYSDQSLLGTPQFTLLNKVYSLNLTYNFFN
jgi:hypothetical protein